MLKKTERKGDTEIYYVCATAKNHSCPNCKSRNTTIVKTGKMRDIRGLNIGFRKTIIRVEIRRIVCSDCGRSIQEPILFCSGPYISYTKWLARYVIFLRKEMSISAVAKNTGLHWETIKNIEKQCLGKKYKRISLKELEYLGIDEVYLGKIMGYITVVRNIKTSDVVYIGKGKGVEALKPFQRRLKCRAEQIKAVVIDMSNSYSAWVQEALPDVAIVYDHFHVIKLMNDHLDKLRRSTMNRLEKGQKKELKNKRFLLLRNKESLSAKAEEELSRLRYEFQDLGIVFMMKEYLRNIYRLANSEHLARTAFLKWCERAKASAIECLRKMAKTIKQRLAGILSYWKHDKITNASQEGFNNKIGWLTRQAYGYRDREYLLLKIYDLPHLCVQKYL